MQVDWTVAISQMIQDDSQLILGRDLTSEDGKMKKKIFLERKGKVWVYIKYMYNILKYWI